MMKTLFAGTFLILFLLVAVLTRADSGTAPGNRIPVPAVSSAGDTILLPITLVSFTARQVGHDIQLSWKAVREENTVGYIVERSTDGKSYRKTGTTGPGKEMGMQQYHFTDTAVTSLGTTLVFYRLTQLMAEGTRDFSHALSVTITYDGFFTKLFPNPAKEHSTVAVNVAAVTSLRWSLRDPSGRIVKSAQQTLQAGTSLIPIQLNGLGPGLYFLQLQAGTINRQLQLVKL